ncbi:MAG: helix-turn-helix transcriptional regulator [Clostridia bacterium]|nr:helix-turn-helix transcriptional regulator [Clostridia bacterium]
MRDVCITVANASPISRISYNHFVYEMELHKLRQPFFYSHYYLYLFVCGEGELRHEGKSYSVKPGTLVLVHPWQMHEIVETKHELTYLYISMIGEGIPSILSQIGAEAPVTVYPSQEHLLDHWMKSIRRVQEKNALYITESVFMHTLSYLVCEESGAEDRSLAAIKSYIQENLQNPEMSVGLVASIFFYSEKYFSYLFRGKTGTKFTDYLNDLRIRYALRLISEGVRSIEELSTACGFANACYFSKVFKKMMGKSPAAYIRERKKDGENDTKG